MIDGGGGRVADIDRVLREAEERFRTLFDQAPIGLLTYDRDLRITDCNLALTEIIGRRYEELIGLDMHRLTDQRPLSAIERVLEGEPATYVGPYRTGSALDREVRARFSPLRDADGEVVGGIGLIEDVSDFVRTGQALREFQQRLTHAVSASPLGMIVWNLDFEVVEWNAAARRIFGWEASEIVGKPAEVLVPSDERAFVAQVLHDLAAGRGGTRATNANVTKAGERILCDWYNSPLLDAHGQVVGIASLVDDVTERRRAHEALERSELKFRALIELAPDAVGVVRDFRWLYVNPALVRLFGCKSADDLVGCNLLEQVHPAERDTARASLSARAEGVPGQPREYRMRRLDGSELALEIVSMPIDYDGAPAVLGFARDITERKQMQLRLLQADRLASVGTLAAGVAHEINNPLAYMLANLDVALKRRLPDVRARLETLAEVGGEPMREGFEAIGASLDGIVEMLDIAREGAERVRAIVRDLRTFSRASDNTNLPVDVRRVLEAASSLAWNQIRHVGRLEKHFEEVSPVAGSESRLGQVFLNLMVNAAQALDTRTPERNLVSLRVSVAPDDWVRVVVEDTGAGMPADVRARVFEPFFTTKPAGEGTGLGLWICHGIVEQLGGRIEIASEVGKGTRVTVLLPPWQPDHREPARASEPPRASASVRGRLLVVDDEPSVARVLRNALAEEHEVVLASDGAKAIEILGRDDAFDLVLCDLMMPEVSGMDVHAFLRERGSKLAGRMIFVTGGAFTARAREFLAAEQPPRVDKPFDVDQLRSYVRESVASHRPADDEI